MGSNSRCNHHVPWSRHACLRLGYHAQRLDHLLYVVSLLLWYWCGWRISDDSYIRHGERSRLWQGLNKGRSSSPRPQSHQRFLDARMGSIRQPSHPHYSPSVLSPRKREPTILGSGRAMDLPYFLCHPSCRYTLAYLLPYFQDEIRGQAIGRGEEEVKGYRLRYSVPQAYFLILWPSLNRNRWWLVLQRHFLLWQQAVPSRIYHRHYERQHIYHAWMVVQPDQCRCFPLRILPGL